MASHGVEESAKTLAEANCANDQLFERLVNGRSGVRLEESVPVAAENAALSQQFELPLHRSRPAARAPNDLTQVE